MIDKKRLEELEEATVSSLMCEENWAEEFYELIRLARLGLWAEKYGVPAVTLYTDEKNWKDRGPYVSTPVIFTPDDATGWGPKGDSARKALAALPNADK